jgi:hypothetical protein
VPSRGRLRGVANEEHTILSRILPLGLAAALALTVGVVAAADKPTTAAVSQRKMRFAPLNP